MRWSFTAIATLVATLASGQSSASNDATPNLAREQRIAEQISEAILDGEPIYLAGADGHRFLAIHTEARETPAKGTVILLHGRGHHPDWSEVVQPLRVGLVDHGWHTLAIQLPVLNSAAKYYEYVEIFDHAMPRIEAALADARARDAGPVVLLAHSCGAHMAQHWILQKDQRAVSQIDAFVGIGMGATDYGQPMRVPFALDRIAVPTLDLYAERDFNAVIRLAPTRLSAIERAGHPKSRQQQIADAEHYFVGRGDAVVEAVADWLGTL